MFTGFMNNQDFANDDCEMTIIIPVLGSCDFSNKLKIINNYIWSEEKRTFLHTCSVYFFLLWIRCTL